MGDLVTLFSQPTFVVIATALLVILAACAAFYFWRSGKARKAYAETAERERELRRHFEAVVSSTRDGVIVITDSHEVAMISDVAARMIGLDVGGMSGFDNAKVDAAFFPDGRVKSNFLCNIGHGDPGKVLPKLPRLSFDEACTLLY